MPSNRNIIIILSLVAILVLAVFLFWPRTPSLPPIIPVKWQSQTVSIEGVYDSVPILKITGLRLEKDQMVIQGYTTRDGSARNDTFTVERQFPQHFDMMGYSDQWRFTSSIVHDSDVEYMFASSNSPDLFSVFLPGNQSQFYYQCRILKDGETLFLIAGDPVGSGSVSRYAWFTVRKKVP